MGDEGGGNDRRRGECGTAPSRRDDEVSVSRVQILSSSAGGASAGGGETEAFVGSDGV